MKIMTIDSNNDDESAGCGERLLDQRPLELQAPDVMM
jgi:hypothetical protein